MIKSVSKKAGAVFLATMLSLCLMPVTNAFAGGGRSATIADVTVSGKVGEQIAPTTVKVTLSGDTFDNMNVFGMDVTSWFGNLPAGLSASIAGSAWTQTTANITITGTPTEKKQVPIGIMIPGDKLSSGSAKSTDTNQNAKFDIKGEPTATVNDVTVSGKVGEAISSTMVQINLTDVSPADDLDDEADLTAWFQNLPGGLTATLTGSSKSKFMIALKGTPSQEAEGPIQILIPAEALSGSTQSLQVTANSNAKYDIKAPKATVDDVTVSGTVGVKMAKTPVQIMDNVDLNVSAGDDVTSWFSNMPAGLTASVAVVGAGAMGVYVEGTPTAAASGAMQITIPASAFGGTEDLKVEANPNAKFDIKNSKKVEITVGGGSHTVGDGKDMTITCSGELESLTGVFVDGAALDSSKYTVRSGSTVLTLKAAYLDTLAAGKHTLKFQYKDNVSAETSFEIVKAGGKKDNPVVTPVDTKKNALAKTGDPVNIALLVALLGLSGGAAAFASRKKKDSN